MNGAVLILAPGETGFVHDGNQCVQALLDGLANRGVERPNGQCRGGRLHSHDIVPFDIGRHSVCDDRVERNVVRAESGITPVDFRTHLLRDDANGIGVSSYDDTGDISRGKSIANRVVYERVPANETDVLVGDSP